MKHDGSGFMAGVVEGFYGTPWSRVERLELFEWMTSWGLNTYLYAPKDDLHHRALWREPYRPEAAETLEELVGACRQAAIHFIYGLSPGLDIRYSAPADLERLSHRFEQMLAIGCESFALLFDDIPDRLDPADIGRWGSLASAQAHVANRMFAWLRARAPSGRLFFCPTPYCGRMAEAGLGGAGYLDTLGSTLDPGIDVFWTGPEIVSREIPLEHVQEVGRILRRKPLLWDNLHANDYDVRRFFCGPYAGRAPDVRGHLAGILSNPNNEFPLNYVPLRTLAAFAQSTGAWDARGAYMAAIRDWLTTFDIVTGDISLEDLVLLGDCYYLPYEEGPGAEGFFARARALLGSDPRRWRREDVQPFRETAARLREVCVRISALRRRQLFHALSRRVWELREEVDLLDRYVALKAEDPARPVGSGFHLPGTFRGGLVSRLQRLLVQKPDGTFTAAEHPEHERPTDPDGPGSGTTP